jgi:hypothetical protein
MGVNPGDWGLLDLFSLNIFQVISIVSDSGVNCMTYFIAHYRHKYAPYAAHAEYNVKLK